MRTSEAPHTKRQKDIARIERLARLLDSRFRIPGTGIRFGLDFIVGLVPWVGDTAMLLPSAWMIWRAREHGMPRHMIWRMMLNSGLDYVVGSIPVLGDIFDIGFKSNLRNATLLRENLSNSTVIPADVAEVSANDGRAG